mmetsp:Transcript_14214/g.38269  ORF Transcript_14214/g.38269 Transcript_14214/m.38269 type:complete len:105 (-) Transcript_14214:513-827(-)
MGTCSVWRVGSSHPVPLIVFCAPAPPSCIPCASLPGYPWRICSWSFNYFFYNHRMKKVLFFTCSCTRISTSFGVPTDSHKHPSEDMDGLPEEEEDMFDFEDETR